ncbi:MAG TPA: MgtC/SapB family protein [Planctomycetota bacterium]
MPIELTTTDVLFRLLLAGGLGALIGIEREARGHAAGFRTMTVLCLASALAMILSIRIAALAPNADPGRIAAQVLVGVGFIGAGVILRAGMTVHGITTAATLWAVSGLGLVAGAGYFADASIATGLLGAALLLFPPIEHRFLRRGRRVVVELRTENRPELVEGLTNRLSAHGYRMESMQMTARGEDSCTWRLAVRETSSGRSIDPVLVMQAVEGVREARLLAGPRENGH